MRESQWQLRLTVTCYMFTMYDSWFVNNKTLSA